MAGTVSAFHRYLLCSLRRCRSNLVGINNGVLGRLTEFPERCSEARAILRPYDHTGNERFDRAIETLSVA